MCFLKLCILCHVVPDENEDLRKLAEKEAVSCQEEIAELKRQVQHVKNNWLLLNLWLSTMLLSSWGLFPVSYPSHSIPSPQIIAKGFGASHCVEWRKEEEIVWDFFPLVMMTIVLFHPWWIAAIGRPVLHVFVSFLEKVWSSPQQVVLNTLY